MKSLSAQMLRALLDEGQFSEVVRLTRKELDRKVPRLNRATLLEAAGIAFAMGSPRSPGDAVLYLEAGMCEPTDGREQAEAVLGNLPRTLAQALLLWRDEGQGLLQPESATSDTLVWRLFEAGGQLLSVRAIADADILLTRAINVAKEIGQMGSLSFRARIEALRVLQEYQFGLKGLSDLIPILEEIAQEQAHEDFRHEHPRPQLEEYLSLVSHFAKGAIQGMRPELARQILIIAKPMFALAARRDNDVERYGSFIAWLGGIAVNAGAFAHAHLLAVDLRHLCDHWFLDRKWLSAALLVEGRAWVSLGEYAIGIERLRRGIDSAVADDYLDLLSGVIIDSVRDLYEAYLVTRDLDGAGYCYAILAEIDNNARGTSLQEIEACSMEVEHPERAIEMYESLLTSAESKGELASSTLIRVSIKLLRLLISRGEVDRAYRHLEVYSLLEELYEWDHPLLSELEELGAVIENFRSRPDWSLKFLARATARDSRTLAQQIAVGSSAQRTRRLAVLRRRAEYFVSVVVEHFAQDQQYVGGAFAIEAREKGLNTWIEWQVRSDVAKSAVSNKKVAEDQHRRSNVRSRLAVAALQLARGEGDRDVVRRLLDESEALDYETSIHVGGIRLEGLVKYPDPVSIAMTLPKDAVFIDYFAFTPLEVPGKLPSSRRYCAFIVQAGQVYQWKVVDIGPADDIDALMEEFRVATLDNVATTRHLATCSGDDRFAFSHPHGDARAIGHQLRAKVFDPVVPILANRTRLVVCPDGPLATLPFDCLPQNEGGELIETYFFSYALSTRSIIWFNADVIHAADDAAGFEPLVIGAPDYDGDTTLEAPYMEPPGTGGLRFMPLSGTRREAEDVAHLLGVTQFSMVWRLRTRSRQYGLHWLCISQLMASYSMTTARATYCPTLHCCTQG